jgi:vanillate O-demethylase ferredoxin subunit
VLQGFEAGAHVDAHLPGNLLREYSLCNAPAGTRRYQIGVLRDAGSRGGSEAMHDHIDVGSVLTISEPKYHFPLVEAKRTRCLRAVSA